MGSESPLIVPLNEASTRSDALVGGKARGLGRLLDAGFRVPEGFCIDVRAYERFVDGNELGAAIRMELGRKPLSGMRWEEIWDAALRIRSAFLAAPFPRGLADPILEAYRRFTPGVVVVRSSAPGEDSAARSYAGLHESLVGVEGESGLIDAVRIVWASLWSDAALLYRRELDLDVARSRMAVVVQELVEGSVSGVGFGIDPRRPDADRALIEAVPGLCEDLVGGAVDPDRWILKQSTGEIVEWTPGARGDAEPRPLLVREDLALLHGTLRSVESLLGSPPDLEWTGSGADLTLLQARPVTGTDARDEQREWYLSLRPGAKRLRELCSRVSEELIPALAAEAAGFAAEDPATLSDARLADALEARLASYDKWQEIYKDEFIPFAHGVRHFGVLYNDALRPEDPYEFVSLLAHQPMMATERNAALARLADGLRGNAALKTALIALEAEGAARTREAWSKAGSRLDAIPGWEAFAQAFEAFLDTHMNLVYDDESLDRRPDLSLSVVLQLAETEARMLVDANVDSGLAQRRLLEAVGPDRREETLDALRIARLSWRLRDDDNILMGRLLNQLQRALDEAGRRLRSGGRIQAGVVLGPVSARALIEGLRDERGQPVELPPAPASAAEAAPALPGESDRQIIGQPAARGLATGLVRILRVAEDFTRFKQGEVMVCDAIQPTMTHLVPLACAIVERRGGMLIHGAIIARELGVPCVNGVADATERLRDGDLVTVDGHLGIVTVGRPDFDLERPDDSTTTSRKGGLP